MALTKLEEQICRTTGVSPKDFEATKAIELMEQAAKTGTVAADGAELTQADLRVIARTGISKEAFIAERRRERGTTTSTTPRKTVSLTADDGQLDALLAARDAQRQSRAS